MNAFKDESKRGSHGASRSASVRGLCTGLISAMLAGAALTAGCNLESEAERPGQQRWDLTNCGTTLGAAPLESTCGHGWVGPFGDADDTGSAATPIAADADLNFPGASPNLAQTRVLYRVALPASDSAVKFTPSLTQDYAFATDSAEPVSVLDAAGTPVPALLSQNIADECAAVGAALPNPAGLALSQVAIFALTAGSVYRVVFESGSPAVNVLVDEPNDFVNAYYSDADADTYGDPRKPLVSECTPPDGYVPNDDDCDDESASVNPEADEVVDGSDNNCDGFVDTAGNGDLEMVSVGVRVPVRRLLVGQSATVVVDQRVQNGGRTLMDATIARTATAAGSGTIAPLTSSEAVDDLHSSERRTIATNYVVTCNSLGTASYTIAADIQPVPGGPTDPDLTNNARETSFQVECIACVHAVESLVLADRLHVTSADVFGGKFFELGSDTATATVTGNVRVNGNAFLRSTARVEGNLTLSGVLGIQGPFVVTGALAEHASVTIPPILAFGFPTSSTGFFVAENTTTTLAPGNYAAGELDFDATANFRAGVYNFTTFLLEPDAVLNVDTSAGDVFINAQSGLAIGDRVEINPSGPGRIAFYTNATGTVRVGTDVHLNASVSAPLAKLQVFSRTTIDGCTSANYLAYEPDIIQLGSGIPTGLPGDLMPPAPSCADGAQNGSETGIDCGGACPNVCPTCTDGTQNGSETGIDCGGACPNVCPTCTDGTQNGTETGVDCGGSCTACPTCTDGIKNGTETGVDCGGSCSACPTCNAVTYQAETIFHSTGGSTPGGWNIWSNGYISTQHSFTAGASRVTVIAKGSIAQNVWPHMVVRVGNTVVGDIFVTNANWQTYQFNFNTTAGSKEIRVTFDNDFNGGGQDRNLYVDSVAVSCPVAGPVLSAALPMTANWGSGYCVNVAVTNNGTVASSSWTVVVNTQQSSMYTSWDGNFSGVSGQVTVTSVPANAVIQPGQTQSAGFCANRNSGTNNNPTVVSATGT
jgi:hypothetical protein